MSKISKNINVQKHSNKKKTHEEYIEEVKLKNPNITVVGKYINARTKITHKCNLCGNEWSATPDSILHGHWCKSCSLKEVVKNRPKTQQRLRKSHEQYVKELHDVNPNIEILDTYITREHKNHFRCNICGHEWYGNPGNYLSNKGCPECGKKKRKKTRTSTHDEFIKKLNNVNQNIEILDHYVNSRTKLACKCKIDGFEFYARPSSLLAGHGCPKCYTNSITLDEKEFFARAQKTCPSVKILTSYTKQSDRYLCECKICGHQWTAKGDNIVKGKAGCVICANNKKRSTNDKFLNKLNKITKNITPIEEYVDLYTKISFKCNVCGNVWDATPLNIFNGGQCPECFKTKLNSPKKSHEQFIEEIKQINPNVTILGKYVGSKNKIRCKCNICNFEWTPIASSLLCGYGCPKCSGRYKSTDEFKKEIYTINHDIEIISEYVNSNTYIQCKCKICGHIWNTIPGRLKYSGCPKCRESFGERKIRTFLDDNNISFTRNKTFEDLKGIKGRLLSYDFYLERYNLLIEFQGKQHEQSIEYFGGEEKFKIQQEHDKRKREYAKLHNINLLEIWYYDSYKIESILLETINNLKLESVETVIPA